ncbi:MAG: response regulator [Acidobacteriia bacterium]|nr:response regulator [Terriglobia bacterium]
MILLVDDERSVRQFARTVLERTGYEVRDAASAEEALRMVRSEPSPQLLLTDIVMPGQNGIWLAAQFHRLHPATPVLFISGYSQNYQDELSGSVCLRKPFTPAELVAAVSDIISASRSARG